MIDLTKLNAEQTADMQWATDQENASNPTDPPLTLQQYCNKRFRQEVLREVRRYREIEQRANLLSQFQALSDSDKVKALSITVTG